MRRRLLVGLLIVLALIAGGLTAYQRIAVSRLKSGFADWARAARSEGWQVSSGPITAGGWPREAVIEMPDFRLASAASGGPAWESQRLRLVLDLFRPNHLTVEAQGTQRAGISAGVQHPFSTRALQLELPFKPLPGAPLALLTATGLRAPQAEISIGSLRLAILAVEPALNFRVAISEVELPGTQPWPLGDHIADAQADAVLSGTLPAPGPLPVLARAWQTEGGQLRITDATVRWGPLDAGIVATAGLDAGLQPVASGTASLTGYAPALDLMAARHAMSNDGALAAKAVLSLLAQTPPGGGAPRVEAPFTLRDQVLSVGPIPLVRVRPIIWAAATGPGSP